MTRRELLKAAGGVVAGSTAYLLAELGSETYRQYITYERSKFLPTSSLETIPDGQIIVGFSPDNNKTDDGLSLARDLESYPQVLNFFLHDIKDTDVIEQIQRAISYGIVPMISIGKQFALTHNKALFFEFIDKTISHLEYYHRPYILRPLYEFNTPWAEAWWGKMTHSQFISGWQDMYHHIKSSSSYAHVSLCYNASIYVDPLNPNSFYNWFPGEDSFDIFALDVYNKNTDFVYRIEHYIYPNFSPKIVLGPDMNVMHQLAPNKGILLSEINCMKERQKADWLQEAINYSIYTGATGWISFDWDKSGVGETRWNIKNYPRVMSTYREELSNLYYASANPFLRANPAHTLSCLYRNPFSLAV